MIATVYIRGTSIECSAGFGASQLRGTLRATARFARDAREAKGTILLIRGRSWFLTFEFVYLAYEQEDSESHNQKVDYGVEK
jgi:hypothetical protein